MSLPASDSFTYSDGLLEDVSGGNWDHPGVRNSLRVLSNEVYSSGSYAEDYWLPDTPDDDQWSKVKVSTRPNGSGECGPCVRMDPGSTVNMYYLKVAENTYFQIYKAVNDTWTQIGSNYTEAVNSGDTFKLSIVGDTLTPYHNDVAKTTQSDSSHSSGRIGIRGNLNTFRMDDWEGGSEAAGGLEISLADSAAVQWE